MTDNKPTDNKLTDNKLTDSKRTIRFYDTHSEEFAQAANTADMHRDYEHFLRYVPKGGTIVDMGCGSGRDLKFFREAGYVASGVDASEGMCRVAREYSLCDVVHCDALSWTAASKIDAIWSNGSLLHLHTDDIIAFIRTKTEFLKTGGILYSSMKAGIPEGFDEKGRYFTPFSETIVESALADGKLEIAERWTEGDSLGREGFHWEAVILRKL